MQVKIQVNPDDSMTRQSAFNGSNNHKSTPNVNISKSKSMQHIKKSHQIKKNLEIETNFSKHQNMNSM